MGVHVLIERSAVGFSKRNIFRRCVECDSPAPECPQCPAGQQCQLVAASCDTCAKSTCSTPPSTGSTSTPGSGDDKGGSSATGAIAGGVVGGVVVIVVITYLVWRFCIKKRREAYEESEWRKSGPLTEKDGDEFATQRNIRASTHTVGSIASSVLTRASNVIQIAYIPGVTNRSMESSPDLLAPPVPPIPAVSGSKSNLSNRQGEDQHYFMPSDLRDSRFSGYSDDARTSLAPTNGRDSIATTYQSNVVVNPLPAQVVARGKANAVSVKSSGKNSPIDPPGSVTPPIPIIDYGRHGQLPPTTSGPIVARLGVPKAVTVTRNPSTIHTLSSSTSLPSSLSTSPNVSRLSQSPMLRVERESSILEESRHIADSSTFDDASTDDDESPAEQSLIGHDRPNRHQGWGLKDSSGTRQSTFKSPLSSPNLRKSPQSSPSLSPFESSGRLSPAAAMKKGHRRSGSLNQIIEEATRRASRDPRHGGLGSVGGWGAGGDGVGSLASWRREGPFADSNAARTP